MKTPELYCLPVIGLNFQSVAADGTAAGSAIDTLGYTYAEIVPIMAAGDSPLTFGLDESEASGSGFAAALDDADTPAAIEWAFTATDDNTRKRSILRLDRRMRYIKIDVAAGSAGSASICGCLVILHGPDNSARVSDALTPSHLV